MLHNNTYGRPESLHGSGHRRYRIEVNRSSVFRRFLLRACVNGRNWATASAPFSGQLSPFSQTATSFEMSNQGHTPIVLNSLTFQARRMRGLRPEPLSTVALGAVCSELVFSTCTVAHCTGVHCPPGGRQQHGLPGPHPEPEHSTERRALAAPVVRRSPFDPAPAPPYRARGGAATLSHCAAGGGTSPERRRHLAALCVR